MKEKILRFRRRMASAGPMIFFGALVCLDYALRFFYRGEVAVLSRIPMVFTLGWSLALTGVCYALPGRVGRIMQAVIGALFGVLALAHSALRNMFGSFFSAADLLYAGEGAAFFSFSYIQIRLALWLCAALFFLGVGISVWLRPVGKRPLWVKAAACAALVLGSAAIAVQHGKLIRKAEETVMTWDVALQDGTQCGNYQDFTNANACLPLAGLYQYTFRDLWVTLGLSGGVDRQELSEGLDSFFAQRLAREPETNAMTGVFAGKNVVFVMMESIDTWLLQPEYMPNLAAVQEKSIDFTEFYTPLYLKAGTFCTEFVSMTGLIPPVKGISTSVYQNNAFPYALPNLFAGEGYSVNSFHPSNPAIYNRGAIHENLGFEKYHNYSDMGMEDSRADSQMLRAFDQMSDREPFMDFIITISAHGPYDGSWEIGEKYMGLAEEAVKKMGVTASPENLAEYTMAVAQAMETDAFVGGLLDELENAGLLADTVLVFYTDHYGKYMSDTDFLMELKDVSMGDMLCRTPCFIYSADQEPRKVDKVCSSVDLAPTVANLFGLPAETGLYVGDDIFGSRGGYVVFPDQSWYDGETYCPSGSQGLSREMSDRTAEAAERVRVCRDILISDYYREISR